MHKLNQVYWIMKKDALAPLVSKEAYKMNEQNMNYVKGSRVKWLVFPRSTPDCSS